MLLNPPCIVCFSVREPIVKAHGGPDAMSQEFLRRLMRARQSGYIPVGVIELHFAGYLDQRGQWVITSDCEDMHKAITQLVIAWEEAEDVDSEWVEL
jgi:hypothetical protein